MNKQNGFTLIEMLIVAAVAALMLTVVGGWAVFSIRTNNKTRLTSDVEQNGAFIMNQIKELMFAADPASFTCNATAATSLTFTSYFDGGQTTLTCNTSANPATGSYYIASSSATLRPVATTNFNLVPRNLKVTNCSNFVTCTVDNYPKVTIQFRLQSGNSSSFMDTYVYKDFRGEFVIRD